MDVRRLRREHVRVRDVLVLTVDRQVPEAIRRCRSVEVARIAVGDQAERADHHRVRPPLVVVREAPVRVVALQCGDAAVGVDVLSGAQEGERAVGRAIERNFRVERLLPPYVTAEPRHLLLEAAVDQRRSVGGARERRRGERKSERGRAVPDVLNGRVVVQRSPVDPIGFRGSRLRVLADDANVDVVARRMAAQRAVRARGEVVVAPLDEATEPVGDLPGEKHARAAEHQAVVALVDRNRIAGVGIDGVVILRVSDGCLRHDRHRNVVEPAGRECRLPDRVAGQLEVAAVRRELGKAHVARDALLAGLSRIRGDRIRASDRGDAQQRDRRRLPRHMGCGHGH